MSHLCPVQSVSAVWAEAISRAGTTERYKKKKSFVICSGIGCMKGVNADNVASAAIRTDDQIVGGSRADF